ncbi:hypothetical protein FQN52_001700, partial [Onygenales sp. PD_12]
MEVVSIVIISGFQKPLSFKGKTIVDRFNGMALIVLGEGFVGRTKTATKVAQSSVN